ncbi:acylneuraminate cytidylyltransferase family protein [Olivibacter sp. 47]|uniref:acylneuraminate cytidylyltransferase family protein n=1 Tax=Olivibacter sp. 47 TaxID=3056486 RepID=UPI0025A48432|nr:acylneuraminate cytidylyltransferase family protein [Olivibacter sp. 47]MDM8177214.1 acylneuraminate cytidylyltransferase family protein [Olivibacter sp. 47]
MKGLVTICARGGSKGIPGKNIKIINNKPLIAYSVEMAERLRKHYDLDIFLSTDSDEIKSIVLDLKLPSVNLSYERPEFLASDNAGKLDAIIDVTNYAEKLMKCSYDFVADLDVTSPLRTVEDLTTAIKTLFNDHNALNLFSVSRANRNPYFNMVEKRSDGYYGLCKEGTFLTRQSAPTVYELNASFYIFKKNFSTGIIKP